MRGNVIDMKDGYTILPSGLEAGHNTDGYDISSSTNVSAATRVECSAPHHPLRADASD